MSSTSGSFSQIERQQTNLSSTSTVPSQRDVQRRLTSGTNNSSTRQQRLTELMAEFRAAAAEGIRVELIDPESRLVCQAVLRVDSDMTSISLQPAFSQESTWDVRDICSVTKGDEFKRHVPELADHEFPCIGLELDSEIRVRCLHFSERQLRDDMYACLKILQMCGDNRRPA